MVGKSLLTENKGKKETHRQWKQGQVSWAEYKDTAKLCRIGVKDGQGVSRAEFGKVHNE